MKIASLFWNAQESRLRALWRLLIFFVLFFVFIFVILPGLHLGPFLRSLGASGQLVADVLPYVLIFGFSWLALWLAARFLDRRPLADYGFHWGRQWWRDFGFGLVLSAFLFFMVFIIELAAGWITITQTFYVSYPGIPFLVAIIGRVLFAIAVGFWESMIFVGYPIRNLTEGLRSVVGRRATFLIVLLLPALVFGLAHIANPHATLISSAGVAFAGILFGLPYVLTGNLALSIGFHLMGDFVEGSLFGWPVSGSEIHASFLTVSQQGPAVWTGGEFGPEASVLLIPFVFLAFILVWIWMRRAYKVRFWQTPLAHYTPARGANTSVERDGVQPAPTIFNQ